jgi:heat shock protein HtpX
MRDKMLMLRMSIVSTILFVFYLGLVQVGLSLGLGVPVIVGGLVLFVGIQYLLGTRGVLRQVGAVDLPRDDFRAFHEEYERAAEEMGFGDAPRLMVAEMGVPNAFAVGRKGKGVVVVSAELLELLDFDEAAAVTAHELAHLKNRDSIVMVVGQSLSTIVGLLVFLFFALADNIIVDLIGWVFSTIAQLFVMLFVLALSRYREYAADRDAAAAMNTGDPLARALGKIDQASTGHEPVVSSNVSALCIYSVEDGLLAKLFSTHPSMEKRIERLQEL